jgi:adenosylhomocysteine nucleosidase
MAIRVVTDEAGEVLPREVGRLVRQTSTAGRLGAAVAALWDRPGSAKDLLRLRETAVQCSEKLAKFLVGVIDQLAMPVEEVKGEE